jgi:hypothetical protein
MKYIGDGTHIPGVPARDLTDEEVREYGEARLLASGLYRKDEPPQEYRPARRVRAREE